MALSSITAPPSPPTNFYIGKGLKGANGVVKMIFGYPLPNYGIFDPSELTAPLEIVEPTTLFDLSSLTVNHEIPVVLYVSPNTLDENTTYTTRWYRARDNKLMFKGVKSTGSPPDGQVWNTGWSIFGWIGWLSDDPDDFVGAPTYPEYKEIQENGYYYATITATGAENFTETIDFAITGIPVSTVLENPTDDGFNWTVRTSTLFDTSHYVRVGIATTETVSGQIAPPSGILDYVSAPASNQGCGADGVISGLYPDTTYTLYGFAQAANGRYYPAGSFTMTTDVGAPDPPASPPVITSRVEGGFNLSWPSSGGASYYRLKVRRGYDNYEFTQIVYSTTYQVTGLQYGVTYYVSVQAAAGTYGSAYTTENPATTAPKTPSITNPVTSNTAIDIRVNDFTSNFDEVQIERYSSSGTYIDMKVISKVNYDAGTRTVTWTGLTGGSTYQFKARTKFYINGTDLYSVNYSNTLIVATSARPTNFVWTNAKVSGSNVDILKSEWDALQSKVNAFREYKGLVLKTWTYTASVGGTLTAKMYNEVRNAIADMNPPTSVPSLKVGISDVSDPSLADDLYAYDLNDLRDSLNSIT